MTTFKTQAEMTAALEFIQYLEQLKSGSLSGSDGINRSLQRLSLSLDGLLEAAQTPKRGFYVGGGTISYSAGTLSWSSDVNIMMVNEVGGARYNVISAASILLPAAGALAYVVLDRATNGAVVTPVVVANAAAYYAAIASQPNRLDYLLIAIRTGDGVITWDNRVLNGQSLTSNGFVDDQYGQQTELTLVRENLNENAKLLVTGGGDISWDLSTEQFSWSGSFGIEFPSSTGINRITAASSPVTISAGYVMYVNLSRDPAGIVNVPPIIAAVGTVPTTDDVFIFAIRKSDGRLYLCNGQSLVDGETTRWGALRTGVQWMYRQDGSGVQVIDFTESGSYPTRSYRVGTNELMVYRNGVKARNGGAYWSGSYPVGTLVGSITTADQYLEEDSGVGTGNRILWLQDDGSSEGHAVGAHTPPWTWPGLTDYVEAFVGVQGDGPSPVEGISIYGSLPPTGPLEGQVRLEAGAGMVLAYDLPHNSIVVSNAAGAGVTSIALSGGSGPKTGAVQLVESTTVDITEPASGQFKFDVKAPYKDGLESSTTPSTANPYTTFFDFPYISGFDVIWGTNGTSPPSVRTGGGVLITDGAAYRSSEVSGGNGRIQFSSANLISGEILATPDTWYYAYLYPAPVLGNKPRACISEYPPDPGDWGVHPSGSYYCFLTSVYIATSGEISPFIKRGSWVELGFEKDITAPFLALTFSGLASYDTVTLEDPFVPAGIRHAKVQLRALIDIVSVAVGDRVQIKVRTPGFDGRSYYATRGTSTQVDFEFEMLLDQNNEVEISGDTGIVSTSSVMLLGYTEGRFTSALDMGA